MRHLLTLWILLLLPLSALADVDPAAFARDSDEALARIAAARRTPPPEREQALAKAHEQVLALLERFGQMLEAEGERIDALLEREARGTASPEERQERRARERARDRGSLSLAEATRRYAETFQAAGERDTWLRRALEVLTDSMDLAGSQGTIVEATLRRGQVCLALGESAAARDAFEALVALAPPEGADPDPVLALAIRAHAGLAESYLAEGRPVEALNAARRIDGRAALSKWSEHRDAVLVWGVEARALAARGRVERGARVLVQFLESQDRARESTSRALSPQALHACSILAELLREGPIVSPAAHHYAGLGHLARGDRAAAIASFKRVVTAARGPDARLAWVPAATSQLGALLFSEERYLEAAIAYRVLCFEFPEQAKARQAQRRALKAGGRAATQLGESGRGPVHDLLSDLIRRGGDLDDPWALLEQAISEHRRGRWAEASAAYLHAAEAPGAGDAGPSFCATALANAGLCAAQAQRTDPSPGALASARRLLLRAIRAAQDDQALAAWSTAALGLARLENRQGAHQEALTALEPFDGALEGSEHLVAARHQQAIAHLALGQIDDAQRRFASVASAGDDPALAPFASALAKGLSQRASEVGLTEPARARALWRAAAQPLERWTQIVELEEEPSARVLWAADVLFRGGAYRPAVLAYRAALPGLTRAPLGDSLDASEDLHRAWISEGYAHTLLGDDARGRAALERARDTVYVVTDGRPRLRGTLLRTEQRGPFTLRRLGRAERMYVRFRVISVDGAERSFYEVPWERDRWVEGADPSRPFAPGDAGALVQPLADRYLVVDGLARATWAAWERTGDPRLLTHQAPAAAQALVRLLERVGDASYAALTAATQIEPLDRTRRLWEARVLFVSIKFAIKDWRGVASDVRTLRTLGSLGKAPGDLRTRLESMLAKAETLGG